MGAEAPGIVICGLLSEGTIVAEGGGGDLGWSASEKALSRMGLKTGGETGGGDGGKAEQRVEIVR